MLIEIANHCARIYVAYKVLQDAGLWTYDPDLYRAYVEAWTEERAAAKRKC